MPRAPFRTLSTIEEVEHRPECTEGAAQITAVNERVQSWIRESIPPIPTKQKFAEGTCLDFETRANTPNSVNYKTFYHPDFADWATCYATIQMSEDSRQPSFVSMINNAHNTLSIFFEDSLKNIVR